MLSLVHRFFLEAIREDGRAILGCEDGLSLLVPAAWLPPGAVAGDEIVVSCHTASAARARHLLVHADRSELP
jgi:hypothetical protein